MGRMVEDSATKTADVWISQPVVNESQPSVLQLSLAPPRGENWKLEAAPLSDSVFQDACGNVSNELPHDPHNE